MKKLGWMTAAAMSLALTAPVGAAEAKYVIECVTRAVEQANAAGDYSGYGAATNSFCVLGGWLATGEQLQYSFSMTKGKSYLIVGAGDGDVKDLDLSVSDGEDAVEDTEDDNTPWVHVKAERTVQATITMKNFAGSDELDFCCFVILEEGGADGSGKALVSAVTGLAKELADVEGVGLDKTPGAICFMGGLFGTGGELGITRTFTEGAYGLAGWGDKKCQDLDLALYEGKKKIAEDTEDDAQPFVECEVEGEVRGTIQLKMHAASGNSWGLCIVLTPE